MTSSNAADDDRLREEEGGEIERDGGENFREEEGAIKE